VYPKHPPAAYTPIAASLGAGPGEPDSALTITPSTLALLFRTTWSVMTRNLCWLTLTNVSKLNVDIAVKLT